MKSQANRLSILSLPEAREVYSVPQFNAREREHFFTFTAESLILRRVFILIEIGFTIYLCLDTLV